MPISSSYSYYIKLIPMDASELYVVYTPSACVCNAIQYRSLGRQCHGSTQGPGPFAPSPHCLPWPWLQHPKWGALGAGQQGPTMCWGQLGVILGVALVGLRAEAWLELPTLSTNDGSGVFLGPPSPSSSSSYAGIDIFHCERSF